MLFQVVDVTSWASVLELFDAAQAFFPDRIVDLVFPNSRASTPGFPDVAGPPDLRAIDVNYKGVLHVVQAGVNIMREREFPYVPSTGTPLAAKAFREKWRGKQVITTSVTGLYPTPVSVVYSSSKWACVGAIRALGPRLRGDKISVNGVAPNLIDTGLRRVSAPRRRA